MNENGEGAQWTMDECVHGMKRDAPTMSALTKSMLASGGVILQSLRGPESHLDAELCSLEGSQKG